MKRSVKTGLIILLAMLVLILPAVACTQQNCNQPVDVDVNNKINVDVDNTFSPDVDVNNVNNNVNNNKNYNDNNNYNVNLNINDNDNKNYNTNNNYNTNKNYVDVDQNQRQAQYQGQVQGQQQSQANQQIVNVNIPKGADGGMLISNSNKAPTVAQLDVGEAESISRLLYPGEVLPVEVSGGDLVSILSASDVALYTVGSANGDVSKVNSIEATPTYDYLLKHAFDWGIVVPIDKIDFWTTKGTLSVTSGATYAIVDNRAPRNGYTHVEITVTHRQQPKITFTELRESAGTVGNVTVGNGTIINTIIKPAKPKPDVYETDEYGRAITS